MKQGFFATRLRPWGSFEIPQVSPICFLPKAHSKTDVYEDVSCINQHSQRYKNLPTATTLSLCSLCYKQNQRIWDKKIGVSLPSVESECFTDLASFVLLWMPILVVDQIKSYLLHYEPRFVVNNPQAIRVRRTLRIQVHLLIQDRDDDEEENQ